MGSHFQSISDLLKRVRVGYGLIAKKSAHRLKKGQIVERKIHAIVEILI